LDTKVAAKVWPPSVGGHTLADGLALDIIVVGGAGAVVVVVVVIVIVVVIAIVIVIVTIIIIIIIFIIIIIIISFISFFIISIIIIELFGTCCQGSWPMMPASGADQWCWSVVLASGANGAGQLVLASGAAQCCCPVCWPPWQIKCTACTHMHAHARMYTRTH